jgi:HTH-type transcriptional regulator, transcriptional repressor of NAD biosynthesis genes
VTLGLVIGKFYPPHRGHKFLIDTARAQCDQLVVILCHHRDQKIPGELRKTWLQEIHPDCEVHLVPDELDDASEPWAAFTLTHLGRAPDIVFSSEDYGPRYAELMGARHIMVDRARARLPISATQIRRDVLAHLHWLEPCVRAYFVRRVVLIGAESSGKTTLAQALAAHYMTDWVAEYGREHWEMKIAGQADPAALPGWTPDEFAHIAATQQARENLAARTANRVLICDTNAFATGTWFERYSGARHAGVDAIGALDRVDLYLLAAPDVPFVQDGVRDGELIRDWMHQRFQECLSAQAAPVTLISGAYPTRLPQAIATIDALLAKPIAL